MRMQCKIQRDFDRADEVREELCLPNMGAPSSESVFLMWGRLPHMGAPSSHGTAFPIWMQVREELRQLYGVEVHDRLEPSLDGADVVMMLRIQKERLNRGGHFFPSSREYSRLFGLNRDKLRRWARKDVVIMHPGPINWGVELEPEVADGTWSVILDQVENGVAVRMAVMYLVLGGERAARKEGRG